MDALGIVEDEVRDQVRRRGLDPAVDHLDLKELVEAAVAEYDRRSMVSALPLIGEVDRAVKRIMDSVAGFGELQPLLDDDEVEEIWINGPGETAKVIFDWEGPHDRLRLRSKPRPAALDSRARLSFCRRTSRT